MSLDTIDSFREMPECQVDYQKIAFVLHELWLETEQSILSDRTKKLILSSISDWGVGSYTFSKKNNAQLYEFIDQDGLQDELAHATSHIHARDIMAQMGI